MLGFIRHNLIPKILEIGVSLSDNFSRKILSKVPSQVERNESAQSKRISWVPRFNLIS